jgi:multisubunit Na+/H+ antiporter MnhG subunit
MARLDLRGKLVVFGVGLLFVVLFGLFMPWWLFALFLFVLSPMFYKLLAT